MKKIKIEWHPLTEDRWKDFEQLFGERGACGGCWCMTWRRTSAEFNANKGAGNRAAIRRLVKSGREPGLLMYVDGRLAGWCSVAPRSEFVRLQTSRVWAPIDDQPVWSVSCFFVAKEFRNQGLSVELLKAGVEFARQRGAKIVEGYPQDLKGKRLPAAFVWTGLLRTFERAGFKLAAKRSELKPIMRTRV